MIVIATLDVIDFTQLQHFETKVAPIMQSVGAKILHAIETNRYEDGSGEEIHILYFPDIESFERYKSKTRDDAIQKLRSAAISKIDIKIERQSKTYSD